MLQPTPGSAALVDDFLDADSVVLSAPAKSSPSHLRLLSYNVQTGIATRNFRSYLTHSWKHVFPHGERIDNLNDIAGLISNYDVVGLQEVDAGSLRSGFINQTEYLALRAGFPVWHDRTNRSLGKFAQHSMGILSRYAADTVTDHNLPGMIPGRGVMVLKYGQGKNAITVVMMHMALGKRARRAQFEFVSVLVEDCPNVILMGDFNCEPDSMEMKWLTENTKLTVPMEGLHTFPSWNPLRHIDHFLVTPSIDIEEIKVLNYPLSDHLPISMTIRLPEGLSL
jgi:endonuclease/exonuclease/phosphatase family metal-dependent hydrolase